MVHSSDVAPLVKIPNTADKWYLLPTVVGLGCQRHDHIKNNATAETKDDDKRPPHKKCPGVVPNAGTTQLGITSAKDSNTRTALTATLAARKRLGAKSLI